MNAQQIYNLWEKSNKVSQEYKNQMKSMSQEEIDIYFSPENQGSRFEFLVAPY